MEVDLKVLRRLLEDVLGLHGLNSMYLLEVLQVPFVVLPRPVAWKVGRLLVLDDFGANVELLDGLLALEK